jgi:hypothetical protein
MNDVKRAAILKTHRNCSEVAGFGVATPNLIMNRLFWQYSSDLNIKNHLPNDGFFITVWQLVPIA